MRMRPNDTDLKATIFQLLDVTLADVDLPATKMSAPMP